MGRERDKSIEAHLATQALERATRPPGLCWCERARVTAAMTNGAEWADSVVLCATHTRGTWKIQGKLRRDGADVSTIPLMQAEDVEMLRGALRCRGFQFQQGRILPDQFTGLEVWRRPAASGGAS